MPKVISYSNVGLKKISFASTFIANILQVVST